MIPVVYRPLANREQSVGSYVIIPLAHTDYQTFPHVPSAYICIVLLPGPMSPFSRQGTSALRLSAISHRLRLCCSSGTYIPTYLHTYLHTYSGTETQSLPALRSCCAFFLVGSVIQVRSVLAALSPLPVTMAVALYYCCSLLPYAVR